MDPTRLNQDEINRLIDDLFTYPVASETDHPMYSKGWTPDLSSNVKMTVHEEGHPGADISVTMNAGALSKYRANLVQRGIDLSTAYEGYRRAESPELTTVEMRQRGRKITEGIRERVMALTFEFWMLPL